MKVVVCKCGYIRGDADPTKPACSGEHDWQEIEVIPLALVEDLRDEFKHRSTPESGFVGHGYHQAMSHASSLLDAALSPTQPPTEQNSAGSSIEGDAG